MKEIKRYDLCHRESAVFLDESEGGFYVKHHDIEPIIKAIIKMKELLKKAEWIHDGDGAEYCFFCDGSKPNHETSCELAKLIGDDNETSSN